MASEKRVIYEGWLQLVVLKPRYVQELENLGKAAEPRGSGACPVVVQLRDGLCGQAEMKGCLGITLRPLDR